MWSISWKSYSYCIYLKLENYAPMRPRLGSDTTAQAVAGLYHNINQQTEPWGRWGFHLPRATIVGHCNTEISLLSKQTVSELQNSQARNYNVGVRPIPVVMGPIFSENFSPHLLTGSTRCPASHYPFWGCTLAVLAFCGCHRLTELWSLPTCCSSTIGFTG